MAYEIKNNTGSLFKNDRRQNDNAPLYQGNAMVDGKMKRISAWVRTSQKGTSYMSLSIEDVQGAYPQPQQPSAPAPAPKPAPAPRPATEESLEPTPDDLPFPMRPG